MQTVAMVSMTSDELPYPLESKQGDALYKALDESVVQFHSMGYHQFITMLQPGPSTWFAEMAINLPDPRRMEVYAEYRGQENSWSDEDKSVYKDMVEEANYVTYVGKGYSPTIAEKTIHELVDHCQMLITVWDSENTGDVYKAILYARKKNIPFLQLNPNDFLLAR